MGSFFNTVDTEYFTSTFESIGKASKLTYFLTSEIGCLVGAWDVFWCIRSLWCVGYFGVWDAFGAWDQLGVWDVFIEFSLEA